MSEFIIKEISTTDIIKELAEIGFDEGYKYKASNKFKYKNLKIYGLTSAQANILKQTALSLGTDCATNKKVVIGTEDLTDVILGGSLDQIHKIAEKLKMQPFGLKTLGENLLSDKIEAKTKIVGILNITPDSFSDGGKYLDEKSAQKHLLDMIEQGADMIDIGAESTKPYSLPVSSQEQIKRLKPILDFVQNEKLKINISVDTRSSEVADFALNLGVNIINDVSGFDYDNKLPEVVAKYKAGVIIQHSKGTPLNMQEKPEYECLIDEIFMNLYSKIQYAKSIGIEDIIADVGIGFGKTKYDNFELLDRIEEFKSLNHPIMVGLSRKSFLGISNNDNDLKDSLSLAYSFPLIKMGIDYLRVHNVKLHKELINSLFM